MRKKTVISVILCMLMISMISVGIVSAADYIGVQTGDEIRYSYEKNHSGAITQQEYVMKIVSLEDATGGVNLTVEYSTEDEEFQDDLDGALSFYGDSFIIKEDSLGPIYDTSDPYDVLSLLFWASAAASFNPEKFIVNVNFEQKYADELEEDGGESGYGALIEFDDDGVLKKLQYEFYDYNDRTIFQKFYILRLANKIPGYSMLIIGLVSICSVLAIWRVLARKLH